MLSFQENVLNLVLQGRFKKAKLKNDELKFPSTYKYTKDTMVIT